MDKVFEWMFNCDLRLQPVIAVQTGSCPSAKVRPVDTSIFSDHGVGFTMVYRTTGCNKWLSFMGLPRRDISQSQPSLAFLD